MLLVMALVGALGGQVAPKPPPSACDQVLTAGVSGAAAEGCRGEDALRRADATSAAGEREQHLRVAARHFRQAANLGQDATLRTRMLASLATVFDRTHLRDADNLEQVLRELLVLNPQDLSVVERLARSQEDRGMIEGAEQTLLAARTQQPDAVEPYKLLAQFYARRVTAMYDRGEAQRTAPLRAGPGERGAEKEPRADGSFEPPARRDRPVYPPEAKAAGIEGVVVVEIVIDERGNVIDATVVRSIPLLDAEALRAVREWRFMPALVNGKPARIRMTTTVNFTLP